jgi:hypothetical protein
MKTEDQEVALLKEQNLIQEDENNAMQNVIDQQQHDMNMISEDDYNTEEQENESIKESHTDQSIDTSTQHSDIDEEEIEEEYIPESDEDEDEQIQANQD